jgi:uncharacterized protein YjiS (DUF1127 family)
MNLSFVKRFFNERKVYRRVYNELMTCTDRELCELGFARDEIHSIAWQAARESE